MSTHLRNAIDLRELDAPTAHGFTMRGWSFTQQEVSKALKEGKILNPAMELFSNVCPWNCDHCFTESSFNTKKRKLPDELSVCERKKIVRDLASLGARSINIVGAGEPTIDPDFFELIEYTKSMNLTPIVYTEGSLELSNMEFCKALYELDATVVLKVNSLTNEKYQNSILVSGDPTRRTPRYNYFKARQVAIENMFAVGFNKGNPTRMAFDTIICKENIEDIESLHRYARGHNIFVLLVNYLPSGRTATGHTNAVSRAEQFALFRRLAEIDIHEYGIIQRGIFPYAGAQPCLIRGTGVFIKINGDLLACPGETKPVGNLRSTELTELWTRLRNVRSSFDGGCPPRELFWAATSNKDDEGRRLGQTRDTLTTST